MGHSGFRRGRGGRIETLGSKPTNQPSGSLKLSLRGHVYLGRLSAIEGDGFCTLAMLQLFPADAIAKDAKTKLEGQIPRSQQTIAMPVFTTVELRNRDPASSSVRLLSNGTESGVEKGWGRVFSIPRSLAQAHKAALVRLQPSTGWSWRAKPAELPWTTWVDISVKRKRASQ